MQERWTALHYAADRGHDDVLHLLVMVEQCEVIVCNKVSQASLIACLVVLCKIANCASE